MYISQKDKIVQILNTSVDAMDFALKNRQYTYVKICMDGVSAVFEYMKSIDSGNMNKNFEEAFIRIYQKAEELQRKKEQEQKLHPSIVQLRNDISRLCKDIQKQKCRYRAVFMPYKASMWTSLESIWRAAQEDSWCDTVVMPLPYFNISDASDIRQIYEGDRFPGEVPIVHYSQYHLEESMPEMGFIHNPYDDMNTLTMIHPQYFSEELKKHISCLVYVPYFTMGAYTKGVSDFQYVASGIRNADKIVAQSELVSRIFQSYGHRKEKMIVQGSPKIDAVVNRQNEKRDVPEEWDKKLNGKVFLLNTHLTYLPKAFAWADSTENYATKYLREIMDTFYNRKDCSLIWRPHPLFFSMLNGKCRECLEFAGYMVEKIEQSNNCVIDRTDDYRMAFQRSDAMLSTWSSLINEYMATGKPVMIFQKQQTAEADARAPIKRNLNYFRFGPGKMSFQDFADMVIKEKDPKYEMRMEMLNQAFVNMDGSAGHKIYREVVQSVIGSNRELIKGEYNG